MRNNILLLFLFVLQSPIAYCQSGFVTTYFSYSDKEVTKSESYYYDIRKEVLTDNDTVVTFYSVSDKIRSMSIVNKHGILNGSFTNYHENGTVKSKGNAKYDYPLDTIISYYPNGVTQAIESFNSEKRTSKIINYYDSTSNQLVTNGSGRCKCAFNSYKWTNLIESGNYENGKRESVWNGYDLMGNLLFKETYEKDSLHYGESYNSEGSVFKYKLILDPPTPVNGLDAMLKHIVKTIRYPAEARRFGIEGTVFVGFDVDTDGSVKNVRCLKGIGGGCDQEAMRVVGSSPKWNPGKLRGQVITQTMVYPLKFKLDI